MYVVVEFGGEEANKTAVVRREWLTPKKKEVFWPPFKVSSQFAKALNEGTCPNEENWTLYPVRRCLYFSDNLLKARQKERDAEKESDLQTEAEEELNKQKRKKRPVIISSSEEEDQCRAPSYRKRLQPTAKLFATTEDGPGNSQYPILNTPIKETSRIGLNIAGSSMFTPESVLSTPASNLSTPVSVQRSELVTNSGFTVVANRLAKLELDIAPIKEYLQEFLPRLLKDTTAVGSDVVTKDFLPPLPCKEVENVDYLEDWLKQIENQDQLVQYLCRIGGRTVEYIVKKLLERIFTNGLAQLFNWTGKHNKRPLKEMRILDIIFRVVRNNRDTASATECEIVQKVRSWFRFAKDREGGREERRKNKNRQQE